MGRGYEERVGQLLLQTVYDEERRGSKARKENIAAAVWHFESLRAGQSLLSAGLAKQRLQVLRVQPSVVVHGLMPVLPRGHQPLVGSPYFPANQFPGPGVLALKSSAILLVHAQCSGCIAKVQSGAGPAFAASAEFVLHNHCRLSLGMT